jgi:hypothetical protein
MFGAVLERRLKLIPHHGLEIGFTGLHDFAGAGQLGGTVLEGCQDVSMDAAPVSQLKTPAAWPPECAQDGSLPAAHVAPVEHQAGLCGVPGELEVLVMQTEMCGGLEGAEQATGPPVAIVEGAAGEVSAAVCKEVRGVLRPAGNIGGCGGVRLLYGP